MDYTDDITSNDYEFGDSNFSPSGAFDDNLTGGSANDGSWYAYSGGAYQATGIIGQDFGAGNEKVVVCYRIYSNGSDISYNPKDWTFEGSNDGSTWDVLDTQTGKSSDLGTHVWNEFPITNSTAYRYYRLNITANGGGSYLIIQEIEMLLEYTPVLVDTLLPELSQMSSDQGLALAISRMSNHRDTLLYFDLEAILSHQDEASGFTGNGQVSGSVAVSGAPAQRRVTLFDHRTLRPLAQTWSDPVSGEYTFSGLAVGRKYLVICDDYTKTYNAAVADWVEAS